MSAARPDAAPDLWLLYRAMLRSRLFEEAAAALWREGKISGEMHLGTGEEAVVAGVVCQLRNGDAMALDHRGTPAVLMRGVDPALVLKELLGRSDGLCRGRGGHMHLFAPELLLASCGIVGASGPAAAGFGLAARILRPGTLAVAFFGEGALNQGMLLESMNLASVWSLPVVFVCKNNGWAITTVSASVTGGTPAARAEGFGIPCLEIDGLDVEAAWNAFREASGRARSGKGPFFIHARCRRSEGHFLGDPLIDAVRRPVRGMGKLAGPLLGSLLKGDGAKLRDRIRALAGLGLAMIKAGAEDRKDGQDPVARLHERLKADKDRLRQVEESARAEMESILKKALEDEAK